VIAFPTADPKDGARVRIGILGSGPIGGTLGLLWALAGHRVFFSHHEHEDVELFHARAILGARTGTAAQAADFGEAVVLSVHSYGIERWLSAAGSGLDGKVLVDATSPLRFIARAGGVGHGLPVDVPAGVAMARRLPGARVVRAFSTLRAGTLAGEAHRRGDLLGIPLAGDDAEAKRLVARLVRAAGFEAVDAGTLAESSALDPEGTLFGAPLAATALRARIAAGRRRERDDGRRREPDRLHDGAFVEGAGDDR